MRIVVHGQQAFGKAVLEALVKRGENVVAVYVAPEKEGAKADPLKEAAAALKLAVHQPASYRKPEWKTDADYATPNARLPRLKQIFATIEEWTMTKTKFEVMALCNDHDIPVGPILSMKELAEESSLRATGTVVEVEHPTRGPYLTVGNPIKLSDSPADVRRSPLLGEHTDEVLREILRFSEKEIADIKSSGALSVAEKKAEAA